MLASALVPFIMASCGGGSGDSDAAGDPAADEAMDTHEDPVDETPDVPADGEDVDGDGWTVPELEWTSCSLVEGEADGLAECTEMEVPWRWGDGDGRTFTVFAKRLPRTVGVLDGQLWLLEGGPGGSGTMGGYTDYMRWFRYYNPSWEVYTLDARGTGHSGFLPCPADGTMTREVAFDSPIGEVQHCIDWLVDTYGADLDIFGATQSSHDLAAFIQATRAESVPVFLWGNSAGTYWAQRFLQLYPADVDGVVIEALLPPDFFGGFQEEAQENVVRAILGMCSSDTFCSSKLPDPTGSLATLVSDLDAGHCSADGWSSEKLRGLFAFLTYYRPYNQTIPAVIYRLARCAAADVTVLDSLADLNLGVGPESGFSIAVFYGEYFSEMFYHPDYVDNSDFLAYLDGIYATSLAVSDYGYYLNDVFLRWPVYDDPLAGEWAVTDTPMLMLQGHLDPATPYSMAVSMADHFTGAHQHFLDFPYASHAIVFGTPMSLTPSTEDCGVNLLNAFLADPRVTLDTDCVSLSVPLDFEGTYDAPSLMGTPDFWEN